MLISIVTPTYNSECYLENCILSIKNQTIYNFEHIIVDGGSTDRTIEIIKKYEGSYPMKWISEKDNGMYDAISKGFNMASGDILCWINSDDQYMPWTCATVEKIFENSQVLWCSGTPAQLTADGMLYLVSDKKITYPQFSIKRGWLDGRRCGCIQQESCFWRRSLYEEAGGLDSNYKLAGDYDLWHKFSKYTSLHSYNTILAGFRVHEGQKSEDINKYCNEAHESTFIETILFKLKVYKIVNGLLKTRMKVHDLRKL